MHDAAAGLLRAEGFRRIKGDFHSGDWMGRLSFSEVVRAAKAKGWKTITMASGHDVMLDAPEELARALTEALPGAASA